MRFVRSSGLGVLVAAVLLMTGLPATASTPSEEIGHLLDFIAASSCAFIRNGVAYDGAEAAAHVKDKYDYKPEWGIQVYPDTWSWSGDKYRWREHEGRGYWNKGVWIGF